jgi:hypothetical protein
MPPIMLPKIFKKNLISFIEEYIDIFVYNFAALKILNSKFKVLEKNMAGVEVKPLK